MNTKEIAAKTEAQVPSYIKQGQDRGNENVTSEDLQLPRIDVLQALSPQINKKKDEYIEGAEVGMLFNTLTNELYEAGVRVTPISFVKRFLVWVDRKKDSDGGLRSVFETAHEAEAFMQSQEDEEKLEMVPTAEHLVLLDDGTEVIISMAKSKTKVSRKFNSLVRLNGGDRFSRSYLMTTVDDKSSQGEFQNISFANAGFPSEEVYLKAEALYTAISSGARKQATGDYSSSGTADEAETGSGEKTDY
jgi:hypothetical protein